MRHNAEIATAQLGEKFFLQSMFDSQFSFLVDGNEIDARFSMFGFESIYVNDVCISRKISLKRSDHHFMIDDIPYRVTLYVNNWFNVEVHGFLYRDYSLIYRQKFAFTRGFSPKPYIEILGVSDGLQYLKEDIIK